MNYFFDKQQAAFSLPFLLSWAVFWETDLLKRCCDTSKPPHLWYHSEWLGKLNNRGLLLSMAGDLARNWMWWNFMSECGKKWKRGRKKVGSKKKNWKRNSKARFRAWTTGTFSQTRQKVSLWRCYVDVTRLNGWIRLSSFFFLSVYSNSPTSHQTDPISYLPLRLLVLALPETSIESELSF